MKILLISNRSDVVSDFHTEFRDFMKDVLAETDFTIHSAYYDKLVFEIKDGQFEVYDAENGEVISNVGCIFYRGPWLYENRACAYYISRLCQWHNIPCVNDYSAYYPGTKFAQNIVFLEQGAPFFHSLYAVQKNDLIQYAETTFGYPYILKTNLGSHGDSNYLVKSREQASRVITDEPDVDFIAQQYCPNDRDYRLLIMGDQELVFERRGGSDTHLNNTSKGGAATRADDVLAAELIAKARDVMKALGLKLAGVDVMPHLDTNELYFLEINSQPQVRTGALLQAKKERLRAFFTALKPEA